MIRRSLTELFAAHGADNQFTFDQAITIIEEAFGKKSPRTHLNILSRRHTNLLTALREKGVLPIGDSNDTWHIEFARRVTDIDHSKADAFTRAFDFNSSDPIGHIHRLVRTDGGFAVEFELTDAGREFVCAVNGDKP